MKRLLITNGIAILISAGVLIGLSKLTDVFEVPLFGWVILFVMPFVFYAVSTFALPAESWRCVIIPLAFGVIGPVAVVFVTGVIEWLIQRWS